MVKKDLDMKKIVGLLLAAACFCGGELKTMGQEPFVWMTNINGLTWKQTVSGSTINQSNNQDLVKIIVPENVVLSSIDIDGCVSLTNLVIQTDPEKQKAEGELLVKAADSGLRNITIQPGLEWQVRIEQKRSDSDYLGIFIVAVTFAEPPKLEIRTFQGTSGWEVEVVWRESSLQAADNVGGPWKDIPASSPYQFPLASAKSKQFFRLKPQ